MSNPYNYMYMNEEIITQMHIKLVRFTSGNYFGIGENLLSHKISPKNSKFQK